MSNHISPTTSPARSSILMTAVVGGAHTPSFIPIHEYNFSADLTTFLDRKEEAMLVLKSDLMAALNKEVKSLDEDSWMFEGPRSRINLISTPGGYLNKNGGKMKHNLDLQKRP